MRRICEYCSDKGTCSYLKHGYESKCLGVQDYDLGYEEAVEKACEWLSKELSILTMDEIEDNFLGNKFKIVLKSDIPKWITALKQAMEERQ